MTQEESAADWFATHIVASLEVWMTLRADPDSLLELRRQAAADVHRHIKAALVSVYAHAHPLGNFGL